jgi:hypothetical protein
VDEAAAGPVTRGLGDRRLVTEQAHQTFEQAIARVQPAAQALISRLRALADTPMRLEWSSGWSSAPRQGRSSPRPAAPPTSR